LLTFGAEVEGAVWWMGASGIDGITAGDGFAFKGFCPATFLLLCIKSRLE
jgi:hypothetical protein